MEVKLIGAMPQPGLVLLVCACLPTSMGMAILGRHLNGAATVVGRHQVSGCPAAACASISREDAACPGDKGRRPQGDAVAHVLQNVRLGQRGLPARTWAVKLTACEHWLLDVDPLTGNRNNVHIVELIRCLGHRMSFSLRWGRCTS